MRNRISSALEVLGATCISVAAGGLSGEPLVGVGVAGGFMLLFGFRMGNL